jgi:transcriptional regulator with XRE-family HTH domain
MKFVYVERYQLLTDWLVKKRKEANLTQAELAERLGKPQSYVSKYENGERRLDVVEFLEAVEAIGSDPGEIIKKLTAG